MPGPHHRESIECRHGDEVVGDEVSVESAARNGCEVGDGEVDEVGDGEVGDGEVVEVVDGKVAARESILLEGNKNNKGVLAVIAARSGKYQVGRTRVRSGGETLVSAACGHFQRAQA